MEIFKAVGNTPLVFLPSPKGAAILGKLERANPTGSVKDRPVSLMLREAKPKPGTWVCDATSGNTGVSLAAFGRAMGLRVAIFAPEGTSGPKRRLMEAAGARVIPVSGGVAAARERAKEAAREEGWLWLDQFTNPANPRAHMRTAAELLRDLGRAPDIFVAGVGTGGTVAGAGLVLRAVNPEVEVVAVSPAEFPHGIEGLGDGKVPVFPAPWARRLSVSTEEALWAQRRLWEAGVMVGVSSGATYAAALRLAAEKKGSVIVVILADGAERYF